jgi:hypothetical protein
MPGVKALRKIQLGAESTAGTAVAATTIWRGMGTIKDDRETVFVEEDVGYLGGVDRAYQPKYLATLDLESVPATFEQLPYILEMGIELETPTQDGAGTDYIYSYDGPTTAQNTPRTFTIEGGDDQQAEEMEYAHAESFTIEGEAGQAVMMQATLKGRQVVTTSFTGALSLPTVEEILTSKGNLFIDDVSGTIGTTQKTNTLLSFALNWTTGFQPVWTADGQLYFSFVKQVMPEIVLDVTFEHDGTAVAEIANWRAETSRLIRLLFEGSVFGTPGTTYNNKTLIIDLAGRWDNFDKIGEQDGNDIVTGQFRARYNGTAALLVAMSPIAIIWSTVILSAMRSWSARNSIRVLPFVLGRAMFPPTGVSPTH